MNKIYDSLMMESVPLTGHPETNELAKERSENEAKILKSKKKKDNNHNCYRDKGLLSFYPLMIDHNHMIDDDSILRCIVWSSPLPIFHCPFDHHVKYE